ncbi:hypothetical protein [Planctomycetes bacterium K23_9]|uniref:Uncharacterized protein n=1 Tax=Stieleria marina TaxID=1930275 RepID=A0A517NM30_9BACT|nr:hypothetical protein K239x_01230 [Planctomycetes bacterium K23_9]
MNPGHLTAIIRMRWQLMRNQFRRSGNANWIVTLILLVLAAITSLSSFVFTIGWGDFFLAKIEPFYVIYVWDVLVVTFLFGWAIGLMTDLQRSEMLSLKNLLHLPISLRGAFFLNYTSSLASLTVLFFLPTMLGLCFASVMRFGTRSLVVFALLASFVFMVTAVSYQLKGWLARMMENKRMRGTVIALTTIVFVLIFQIPMMLNMGGWNSWGEAPRQRAVAHQDHLDELQELQESGELTPAKYTEAVESAKESYLAAEKEFSKASVDAINAKAKFINAVLPIGWLPYGASAAAQGAVLLSWLFALGMSAIGMGSLANSYRSTIRAYTGHHNKSRRQGTRIATSQSVRSSLLEKNVPGLSGTQSVIALASFRSMLRAPEAKLALMTPLIFALVFGSLFFSGTARKIPQIAVPWLGVGALGMSLVSMVQMMVNVFGLDRHGFRFYVLMPARRRDILLGKNLGLLPVAGTLSALLVLAVGVIAGMRGVHIFATLLQIPIAFLIYSTVCNYTSIVAPMGMAVGTMKPVSIKLSVVVMQLITVLVFPLAIAPAAIALATEQLAQMWDMQYGIPWYLLLTLIEIPTAFWFYDKMLDGLGGKLQQREQTILENISKVDD